MPSSLDSGDASPMFIRDRGAALSTCIRSAVDIVTARQRGRAEASALGFNGAEVVAIATAISEVARNIVQHAASGEIVLRAVELNSRRGLQIVARDGGPGIADVAKAVQYANTSRDGIGVGLPGVKGLMDEFDIVSAPGRGTKITMTKWLP